MTYKQSKRLHINNLNVKKCFKLIQKIDIMFIIKWSNNKMAPISITGVTPAPTRIVQDRVVLTFGEKLTNLFLYIISFTIYHAAQNERLYQALASCDTSKAIQALKNGASFSISGEILLGKSIQYNNLGEAIVSWFDYYDSHSYLHPKLALTMNHFLIEQIDYSNKKEVEQIRAIFSDSKTQRCGPFRKEYLDLLDNLITYKLSV